MIPIILTFITIVIPFASIWFLMRSGKKRGARIENFILTLSILIFAYFAGGWLYSSYYLKYILAIVFIITTVYYFKKRKENANELKRWTGKRFLGFIWKLPLTAGFIALCYIYFSSILYPEPSVNIQFPFKNGNYVIMQGGGNKYMNIIHGEHKYSLYAFDVVKLNFLGGRAWNVFSTDNSKYEIFGEKMYAPLNGKIVAMKSDMPDNIPPDANITEKAGNYIVIQDGNTFVMLAHFRQGTIALKQFDDVKAGDYLGEAGNSGNSLEPHLHIEARQVIAGVTIPVAINFDGEIYTYNDLIRR